MAEYYMHVPCKHHILILVGPYQLIYCAQQRSMNLRKLRLRRSSRKECWQKCQRLRTWSQSWMSTAKGLRKTESRSAMLQLDNRKTKNKFGSFLVRCTLLYKHGPMEKKNKSNKYFLLGSSSCAQTQVHHCLGRQAWWGAKGIRYLCRGSECSGWIWDQKPREPQLHILHDWPMDYHSQTISETFQHVGIVHFNSHFLSTKDQRRCPEAYAYSHAEATSLIWLVNTPTNVRFIKNNDHACIYICIHLHLYIDLVFSVNI